MKPDIDESSSVWLKLIGSAALGAAAMYVFDPVRGRRRRAIVRDKATSLISDARDLFSTAARDVRFRARGLSAEARRHFRHEQVTDDLVLIERVRSKMGRVVSHPHAIQVGAEHGRVNLSGPILANEVPRLLQAVRSVSGVIDIEEHLVAYDKAASIPSLQGGSRRMASRARRNRENWAPAARAAAVIGGGALAICGLRQGGVAGALLAGIGLGLSVRGMTNMPARRLMQAARERAPLRRHTRERASQSVPFEYPA